MLTMFGWLFVAIALGMGVVVFRLGHNAGWHWGGCGAAAVVPVVFTYFLGIIGLLIGGAFMAAIWKAAA